MLISVAAPPFASSRFFTSFQRPARVRQDSTISRRSDRDAFTPESMSPASTFSLTVIAGNVDGLAGPVEPRATRPLLARVELEDDRPLSVEIPGGHAAWLFVHEGEVDVEGTAVPRGVVGIIAPWNYPVGNFMKSLFPALLAGTASVVAEAALRAGQRS